MKDINNILQACQQNKPSGQKALYEHFADKLYSVAFRYAKNRRDTEDIVHDAFIKIFKHINSFTGNGDAVHYWMIRITVNEAITKYRKKQRTREYDLELVTNEAQVEPTVFNNFSAAELNKMILSLPETLRYTFNLYVVEGYSHKEIGEMLNIKTSSSRSRLTRAKNALKHMLNTRNKQACQKIT